MTEIVQRLRFLAAGQNDPHSVELACAADEIERLNAIVEMQAEEMVRLYEEVESLDEQVERLSNLLEDKE